MDSNGVPTTALDDELVEFYGKMLDRLIEAEVPFLIGGAFALEMYTGVTRHTKDLDLFVHPNDFRHTLEALEAGGAKTSVTFSHWLGKAYHGENFIDIIFSSGNGLCPVDDEWFEHASSANAFGREVALCPIEEMIWQKAFIMTHERYDGSDVAHLLWAGTDRMDWQRLLRRFAGHEEVLLSQLVLFGYIYPAERQRIPVEVLQALVECWQSNAVATNAPKVCRGTLFAVLDYARDIEQWGYLDARLQPYGPLTPEENGQWTEAFREEGNGAARRR